MSSGQIMLVTLEAPQKAIGVILYIYQSTYYKSSKDD